MASLKRSYSQQRSKAEPRSWRREPFLADTQRVPPLSTPIRKDVRGGPRRESTAPLTTIVQPNPVTQGSEIHTTLVTDHETVNARASIETPAECLIELTRTCVFCHDPQGRGLEPNFLHPSQRHRHEAPADSASPRIRIDVEELDKSDPCGIIILVRRRAGVHKADDCCFSRGHRNEMCIAIRQSESLCPVANSGLAIETIEKLVRHDPAVGCPPRPHVDVDDSIHVRGDCRPHFDISRGVSGSWCRK